MGNVKWDKKFKALPLPERCRLVRQEIEELERLWETAIKQPDWSEAKELGRRIRYLYRKSRDDKLLVERWVD